MAEKPIANTGRLCYVYRKKTVLKGDKNMSDFVFTKEDKDLLARLQSFIPEKVFDMHAHIHNVAHIEDNPDSLCIRHGTATAQDFLDEQKELYGDRKVRGMLIPFPTMNFQTPGIPEQVNEWFLQQLATVPTCVGEVFVKPGDTREYIESLLVSPQVKGFKCYHITAKTDGPTFKADIAEYLPEVAWEIANERGLVITLHMVKDLSLADPVNLAYIKEKTAQYPNAKLILAHCARGFSSWTTIETVRQLKGIPNLYYDMAAICEPATMYEVIRQAGVDKVMWGSDYCIDRVRGRAFSCGETFTWVYDYDLPKEGINMPMSLVCLESLFAFYQASLMLELTQTQVEDIFYNNAVRLLGLED